MVSILLDDGNMKKIKFHKYPSMGSKLRRV